MSNDDIIRAGRGFGTHSHRDMEIVTWVLDGELEHRDSTGTVGVIYPGLAQRMSAGRGIQHSETNASATADVHLVQMWVLPDTEGIEPGYEQHDVSEALSGGGLVTVASGRCGERAAVTIHQRDAELLAGRLAPGVDGRDPGGAARARVRGRRRRRPRRCRRARTGDAVRLTDEGPLTLTAGPDGCEVLVWATA